MCSIINKRIFIRNKIEEIKRQNSTKILMYLSSQSFFLIMYDFIIIYVGFSLDNYIFKRKIYLFQRHYTLHHNHSDFK